MYEKREHYRMRWNAPLRWRFDQAPPTHDGVGVDVSVWGLRFCATPNSAVPRVGDVLELWVSLFEGDPEPWHVQANVLRVQRETDGYHVACQTHTRLDAL